jgi:uncharacterized protein
MMITRILLMASVCVSLVQTAGSAPPAATTSTPTPASSPTPAAPPSEASIKQLLEVAQSHKLVDSVMSQMDNLMEQTIAQATKGQQVSAKVQKDIDRRRAEVAGIMKELLDWKKLEPMYVRIYQKTFTQPEVDGMIAFYKSPAGQAVITKMPSAMQTTMDEMQGTMGPVMQKMQQMQQDVVAEIKAENKNKGG